MLHKRDYDAVVIGSGPNGLAAAILMQQNGLSVLLIEGKDTIGGGMRSAEVTLPGFTHDICSAVHPLAAASPFFSNLPLSGFGLRYLQPEIAAAHPFDDGTAALLHQSIAATASTLGADKDAYLKTIGPVVENWPKIARDVLAPLHFPEHPLAMLQFGLKALPPATQLISRFSTEAAKGFISGMAAHAIQPLDHMATSAVALVLLTQGHLGGWPVPEGGSQSIADALAAYFQSIGGKIETNFYVSHLKQLPATHAVLFDVTPRQLLQIAGHKFSPLYCYQLEKFRYGPGVFKVDWALDAPVPFTAGECRSAGTVHIGGAHREITAGEQQMFTGIHPARPFVLLAQQSVVDSSRAPKDKHTLWGYCHVPKGSTMDMTNVIEQQIERFAPGFRERILARHTMNTQQVEEYNPNYIGGDINGGLLDIRQLFTRPALRWSLYRTSAKGLYICSSSAPPGGGVHGMCGYYAAKRALNDVFHIKIAPLI